jgi:phage terminase large subunit GpA-like protein
VFLASTPTIKGLSRIEREYEASDQRRYFVPCPHCGERQYLTFERLRWEKGKPESAAYHCNGCEQPIAEHHKTMMLAEGEWRPTATPVDPLSIGFHLSSLYSPVGWLSWERIAREWAACQTSDEAKRSFINTVLGETWAETGEAPDWQRLYERREDWRIGTVPLGGLFLTVGADVQKDRIEVSIWAWGRGLESWLIDHIVIDGGPERPEAWARLTELLGENWPHASGQQLAIDKLAIDTDAAIELDGSTHQTFWGTWQTIPPLLRQSINTTVALFGRQGDGATPVELVDWFTLDVRGVDLTSAARLLPRQVTPSEIADPSETELRSFSPKDIADIVAAVLAW